MYYIVATLRSLRISSSNIAEFPAWSIHDAPLRAASKRIGIESSKGEDEQKRGIKLPMESCIGAVRSPNGGAHVWYHPCPVAVGGKQGASSRREKLNIEKDTR